MRHLTGWSKKGELADFLGIKRQSVSGAVRRGVFPLEWAYKIAIAFDSSTDWVIDGRGSMRPGQIDPDKVNHLEDPIISELRLYLRDLVGEDPDRIGWFRVELTEKLPGFKEWREKNRNDPSIENSATG